MIPLLGRFLEVGVHSEDLLASIQFYEQLGFSQATTSDTRPHPYAVMTDGRLAIGLHAQEMPSPSLTFVQPGLTGQLARIEALGIELDTCQLGDGVFNELAFSDPDGHRVTLLEARTFSPVNRAPGQTSRFGWFEEVALAVADLQAATRFWERLGFVAAGQGEQPLERVSLTSDSLNIALMQAPGAGGPALVFTASDMPERIQALADAAVAPALRLPGGLDPRRHALLAAPEGTRLLLLTED